MTSTRTSQRQPFTLQTAPIEPPGSLARIIYNKERFGHKTAGMRTIGEFDDQLGQIEDLEHELSATGVIHMGD